MSGGQTQETVENKSMVPEKVSLRRGCGQMIIKGRTLPKGGQLFTILSPFLCRIWNWWQEKMSTRKRFPCQGKGIGSGSFLGDWGPLQSAKKYFYKIEKNYRVNCL